jgi:hypothetical protein
MARLSTSLAAIGLGAIMTFTSMVPVSAQPLPMPKPQVEAGTDIVQVRERGRRIIRERHHNWRRDRGWRNHREWRGDRGWRGHRGYSHYRHGYRRHSDGLWYPLAAFGAGAIIGGAIAAPSVRVRTGSAHRNWCRSEYRSYRSYDNTFQPYNGPRRQCISPYGG